MRASGLAIRGAVPDATAPRNPPTARGRSRWRIAAMSSRVSGRAPMLDRAIPWACSGCPTCCDGSDCGRLAMTVEESEIRMTARIHKVEAGVYEADFTIEPTEELT